MIRALRILPEAEAELLEATAWYESKRSGLGAEFIRTIDRALARILAVPEASALWRKGYPYRNHALRRYPYVIFFIVSPEQVEVFAFAHTRRSPGYWMKRAAHDT